MIPTLLTHGNHNACYHNRKGTSLPFYESFTNSKSFHFKIISAYDELINMCIARAECDGTHAETRFRLSPKRTGPFKSLGVSVQSTTGSRGVRISLGTAGYTMFGGGVRVLATHSIHQFPLHFPSRASPCAIRFRTSSTMVCQELYCNLFDILLY